MKLEKNKLHFSVGKNNSKYFYKVHFIFSEEKDSLPVQPYKDQWEAGIFKGDSNQKLIDESTKTILIGLGKKDKLSIRSLANLFLSLGKKLRKWEEVGLDIYLRKELTEAFDPELLSYHLATSLELGYYDIRVLATKDKEKAKKPGIISFQPEDLTIDKKILLGLKKASTVARHVNGVRYIAHLPSNHFTPLDFEKRSKEIAKESKLKITVLNESQLKKLGMGGILAVSQGSNNPPRVILLDYHPTGAKKTLAIIGKGLTFDSGGISIKPSADMHEMKYDMCGAASTIHAIAAIAELKYNIRVVAAIGACENMPDAKSIKPGDVYTAYNGLTIEVQNTDAEGRLVLGDVLSYVSQKIKPDYMVDMATLTGAAIIALGHEAAALLSKNENLSKLIQRAAEISEDRVWPLPLWEEYGEPMKSDIADWKNISGGRGAGTITGGFFLSQFVDEKIPWAHLDIAGTAWRKKSSGTQTDGPTGYGVRLMVELARLIAEES